MNYFVYSEECGFCYHETEEQALADAKQQIAYLRKEASFDGEWSYLVSDIVVGKITHRTKPEGDEDVGFEYNMEKV